MDPYTVVKTPIVTEKFSPVEGKSVYAFKVDTRANKVQIKQALEKIYASRDIKVDSVNTMNMNGKYRRRGRQIGRTSDWKKAIVTLREGDSLDLM